MDLNTILEHEILLMDGAMGTMLQQNGLGAGDLPERFNIDHPEIVERIHRTYINAGARMITANTFEANELKLTGGSCTVEAVIQAGVSIARKAGAKLVALDIGPLGPLMEPMGTLSLEDAYEMFKRQMIAGEKAGADCVLLETFSDLYEAKAAILAAKENTDLPVICTFTYQADGRTFIGCDPVTATLTLGSLGVDALGVNCSLGPKDLMPLVETVLAYAKVPVIVQANAGLPTMADGETVYTLGPEEYAGYARDMAKKGVRIIGGCCGTTPDHIARIKDRIAGLKPVVTAPHLVTAACTGTKTTVLDDGISVIGERINPTGKKKLKEALRAGDMNYILGEALDQMDAGADLLDVNVGLPELDEPALMERVVREVQGVVNLPLQIDSSDPAAIERGVRLYNGRPLINSVNGKRSSMETIFPIAKKYGALVVGLTLDEDGIPSTPEGRLAIAERLLENALAFGIPKEDLLIDTLVLTASAQQDQVTATLKTIQLVKGKLRLKTVLGVSNVSFGLPSRELLNATFLSAAFGAGLDAPILNPLSSKYMEAVDAFRVLNAQDRDAVSYIAKHGAPAPVEEKPADRGRDLREIILQCRKEEAASAASTLLQTMTPLEIISQYFVPALDDVGARYEAGQIFLPQLIQSAETVKKAFAVLKDYIDQSGQQQQSKGKILLATVEGDIHDIGKNIVKMVLENYGYDVIDLGKDVPVQAVVEAARKEHIRLAGLSALMTTTVKSMKETISAVKSAGLDCRFMVGGAVLNEEYKAFVGADYYARDAMENVAIANAFFGY